MPSATNASNLYVHSGGGQYGWRVAMGVSEHLVEVMKQDGHVSGELAAAAGPPPSLDGAAPRTRFDPAILSIDRFSQLPLWPRALFGW